jgi:WS/DGAT/MGAT family acyltransferase
MARHLMSAADAAWLHMDRPTNLMVVNGVLLFDEPLDRGVVEAVLAERLVARYPRFSQRVVEAGWPVRRTYWEDDPGFDLANHLWEVRLPPPGDQAALEAYVGRLMSRPLDRARPLWELHLVEGVAGGCAIVNRMHHAIADGIALSRVLLSLTDEGPEPGEALADAPVEPHVPAVASLLGQGAGLALHPSRVLGVAQLVPGTASALAKELLTPPDARTAFRGRNGLDKRATWSRPYPLADLKRGAHAHGATVNDVILAAVAGALREYLVGRSSAVHDLRALVPFNLWPLEKPLPRDLGNHFGLIFCTLPVAVADPIERVAEVHRRMQHIKDSMEPAVSFGVLRTVGLTAPQLEKLVVDFFTAKASAVMTNVPGPRRPVWFAGHRVRRVIGWVPRSGNVGLGISIFSYDGDVTVGFSVDAGLVPDPGTVIDALDAELDLLLAAVPVG